MIHIVSGDFDQSLHTNSIIVMPQCIAEMAILRQGLSGYRAFKAAVIWHEASQTISKNRSIAARSIRVRGRFYAVRSSISSMASSLCPSLS
jgi:hypothetical protein